MNGKISEVSLLAGSAKNPRRRAVQGLLTPPPAARRTLQAILDYLRDRREPDFSAAHAALEGLTPFTRKVVLGTRRIPMGKTVTYTEFARMLKLPAGARRAVGAALGRNPLPILFPCHRIVGALGLGGFSGGLAWKRRLLAHESVRVP